MNRPTVLIVGLEPKLIDFSEEQYRSNSQLNAQTLQAALAHDQQVLGDMGFDATLCMIDFGKTAEKVVRSFFDGASFDYILIGAGVRLNARNTALFEAIINIVHQHAPLARLCFNTKATDTAEAVQRSARTLREATQINEEGHRQRINRRPQPIS